jgi:hypothetical protein
MDVLKDPTNSRVVKTLPLPPQKPLSTEQIFKDGSIDWRLLRAYLKKEGKLTKSDFVTLIKMASNILSKFLLK